MSVEILLMSCTSVWQFERLGLMLGRKKFSLSALVLHCIAFASYRHGGNNNIGLRSGGFHYDAESIHALKSYG